MFKNLSALTCFQGYFFSNPVRQFLQICKAKTFQSLRVLKHKAPYPRGIRFAAFFPETQQVRVIMGRARHQAVGMCGFAHVGFRGINTRSLYPSQGTLHKNRPENVHESSRVRGHKKRLRMTQCYASFAVGYKDRALRSMSQPAHKENKPQDNKHRCTN